MKSGQDEGDKSGQRMRKARAADRDSAWCVAVVEIKIKLDSNCQRMLMNWCVWFGLVNLVLVNLRGWCGRVDGTGVILVCG